MISKRSWQHILFWSVYYGICLYNELYFSKSFSEEPTWILFSETALALLCLLFVKMAVSYFVLYKLLHVWLKEKNNGKLLVFVLLTLFLGTLALRLTTQFIIWPYIYHEYNFTASLPGMVARFFYSLFDLFQIVGAAVCIKLYKLRLESNRKEKKLILEKSRAEVLHLKSQTNPHFLFNTLNSIYSLSRSKSEQTPDAIMRLSKILRYTLYDTEKETISIREELKTIKDYIDLQQLRFSNRIDLKYEVKIDSDHSQIAPLLLLPLLENAYKHCDENNATIIFDLTVTKNVLHLVTSNPYSKTEIKSSGTGLFNINRQLELLYKEFSLKYFIKEGFFILELTINLNSYAGNELFDIGG